MGHANSSLDAAARRESAEGRTAPISGNQESSEPRRKAPKQVMKTGTEQGPSKSGCFNRGLALDFLPPSWGDATSNEELAMAGRPSTAFGIRNLNYWLLGPSGHQIDSCGTLQGRAPSGVVPRSAGGPVSGACIGHFRDHHLVFLGT